MSSPVYPDLTAALAVAYSFYVRSGIHTEVLQPRITTAAAARARPVKRQCQQRRLWRRRNRDSHLSIVPASESATLTADDCRKNYYRLTDKSKVKVKADIALPGEPHLRDTGRHLLYALNEVIG